MSFSSINNFLNWSGIVSQLISWYVLLQVKQKFSYYNCVYPWVRNTLILWGIYCSREILNDFLKFTYGCNNHSIKLLDFEIFKGERFNDTGILHLKCFTMNTENILYLHLDSNLPISNPLLKVKAFVYIETPQLTMNLKKKSF